MGQELAINFAGLMHDHSNQLRHSDEQDCSTVAIFRQHPMYDCLVLVKKWRACLQGQALEFPTGLMDGSVDEAAFEESGDEGSLTGGETSKTCEASCARRRLISRIYDADDPIYGCGAPACDAATNAAAADAPHPMASQFPQQLDDRGQACELVYVPINGLLDRLKAYSRAGLAVDSRVYAFGLGLRTGERILTTGSQKELQEVPI